MEDHEHTATAAAVAPTQHPTIGRIVRYRLSAVDADAINRRRRDADDHLATHQIAATGVQLHVGNAVHEGDEFPAIITRVWGDQCVNAQLFLDGNDLYWLTSILLGTGIGSWSWPPREWATANRN